MSDINEHESIREQLNENKENREAESRFKNADDSSNDNAGESKSRFENAEESKNDKTEEPQSRFEDANAKTEFEDYKQNDGDRVEPGATMSHAEFIQEHDKLEAEIEGKIEYPDNKGAVEGTERDRKLEVGEEFTRRTNTDTVNDDGSFAGEKDISFEESSLPGDEEDYDVTNYRVTEDMPDDYFVTESEVAPAFDREGGGTQYEFKRENPWNPDAEPLNVPIQDMKDYGYIKENEGNNEENTEKKDSVRETIKNKPETTENTERKSDNANENNNVDINKNTSNRSEVSNETTEPKSKNEKQETAENSAVNSDIEDDDETIETEIEEDYADEDLEEDEIEEPSEDSPAQEIDEDEPTEEQEEVEEEPEQTEDEKTQKEKDDEKKRNHNFNPFNR